jgi:hypothetical protein
VIGDTLFGHACCLAVAVLSLAWSHASAGWRAHPHATDALGFFGVAQVPGLVRPLRMRRRARETSSLSTRRISLTMKDVDDPSPP